MSELTLTAEVRTALGRRARALRRSGKIPGVYYGHGQKNIPVSLTELELKPLYKTSATHIINLKLNDGSAHQCILKDIEFDPITDRPVHFDLFGLNMDEEVVIEVPVTLTGGVPEGVKAGGILQHIMHKLRLSCLPKNIPDHIEVDVATLGINKSIHVGDLNIPNVKFVTNAKAAVVAVVPPVVEKVAEVAVAEVAAVPTEPEVIAKGKKPEEGAAPAAAATGAAPAKAPAKEEKKK
jgi:large subunit ribosomal protein L25